MFMFSGEETCTEICKLILERGSDLPNDKSRILSTMKKTSWWTPFHSAVISDKLATRKRFHYKQSKITPLDLAIMISNLDAVKTIIGPNIKCDVNDCLRISIFSKRNELARFFLDNGADPYGKNKLEQNTFHIATATNNYHMIRTLHEFSLFQNNKRKTLPSEIGNNQKYLRIS